MQPDTGPNHTEDVGSAQQRAVSVKNLLFANNRFYFLSSRENGRNKLQCGYERMEARKGNNDSHLRDCSASRSFSHRINFCSVNWRRTKAVSVFRNSCLTG